MSRHNCYHCGLPVPAGTDWSMEIRGAKRQMCCPGCLAVASTIVEGGLDTFYKFRSANALRPDAGAADGESAYLAWDLPEVQEECVEKTPDGSLRVRLSIEGITCAACTWLIEKYLQALAGVQKVRVNGTTHRAEIVWRPEAIALSSILQSLSDIGYRAVPVGAAADLNQVERNMRSMLMRMGLAGLAMMQTGMLSVALYAGAFQGIEAEWERLLRFVSLLFVTPVVLYSAQPFFAAAGRSLRAGHLVMDVPVSLAIAVAYLASLLATARGSGETYFDSVAMFTFFLLLGRFLEQRIRYRNLLALQTPANCVPPSATLLENGVQRLVPAKSLRPGDRIRVFSGATLPCDGYVVDGASRVDEAILTGESAAVAKSPGSSVWAGSVNGANPLLVEVSAVGNTTRISAILRLVEQTGMERPRWVSIADRVAAWFVGAVLLLAMLVFIAWWHIDAARALWVTLSVLVVTCPCALSLAMPTAYAVATGALRRAGLLVVHSRFLEVLATVDRVAFDKTGTLTVGKLALLEIVAAPGQDTKYLRRVAGALEAGGFHPLARALDDTGQSQAQSREFVTGNGVTGKVDGRNYAFGRPSWAAEVMQLPASQHKVSGPAGMRVTLATNGQWLADFYFDDRLRDSAAVTIGELQKHGLTIALLSGDPSPGAQLITRTLNIEDSHFGLQPAQKLAFIKRWQGDRQPVLMVGDGINDVPVLQAADVSIAMDQAADLARINADAILLSGNLQTLPLAHQLARRTARVVRQNISWAAGYNLLALPVAAMGWVPPWLAAIGMSASSLLVMLNALRLSRLN